ncbi:MAG TPA: pantoate--beta-alanine ligase [Paludibacter sp.]|nr:pantoate--beta-alanine ligase [Paludibacter sp.]
MKIIRHRNEITAEIELLKAAGKTIGFVPTMGALHDGHKTLVARCVAENDVCVVSVFVNPTQFNNATDLEKYPRNLERDAEMLQQVGCQLVFSPEPDEIYDSRELNNQFEFDFNGLDTVMEGKFRPGHFNGVVQIVSKFFQLVQPDKAYFGEKDFQQLAIIHHMVKTLGFNVEIIDCPIVREASGLALSSRNERLTSDQRKNAIEISKVLFESRNFVLKLTPKELTRWVVDKINAVSGLEVEYYEIVNSTTLQLVDSWSEPTVGCIAVFCGEVRLIDNVRYNS